MTGRAAAAPDAAALGRAVEVLRRGGLVAFPTETVYGLGADADSPHAVRAIFEAKGRPSDHPVIVHLAAAGAADAWAAELTAAARTLMRCYWPGPLTLVVRRSARAHDALTGAQDTVGLRCPSHPWAQELLRAWCEARADPAAAIAAPSANRFGRISPSTAAHVRADLGEKPAGSVDLILDGGACPVGIESTIVDLSGGPPRVLRPGSITRAQLAQALGAPVGIAGAGAAAPRASGRLAQHYAPRKALELVEPGLLAARLNALRELPLAVLAPAQALLDAPPQVVLRLVAPASPQAYAHRLYDQLHRMDASGAERLLVAMPPEGEAWDAVRDRLGRAAGGGAREAFPDAD